MVVERHYTDEGTPAFLIVYQTVKGQPGGKARLVYPSDPSFERLWAKGQETE